MYHNLGSKIVIILLIPNSTSNYKAGFPGGSVVKNPLTYAGDTGLIPGSGRSPEGNGNPLQYSCWEDRGAWRAIVHGIAKSWSQLSD